MTLRKIRPSCRRAVGLASGGDEVPSSRDLLVTTFSASDAPNEDLFMRPAAAAADHWKLMLSFSFSFLYFYRRENINEINEIGYELVVYEWNKCTLGKINNEQGRNDEMCEIKRKGWKAAAPFIRRRAGLIVRSATNT